MKLKLFFAIILATPSILLSSEDENGDGEFTSFVHIEFTVDGKRFEATTFGFTDHVGGPLDDFAPILVQERSDMSTAELAVPAVAPQGMKCAVLKIGRKWMELKYFRGDSTPILYVDCEGRISIVQESWDQELTIDKVGLSFLLAELMKEQNKSMELTE